MYRHQSGTVNKYFSLVLHISGFKSNIFSVKSYNHQYSVLSTCTVNSHGGNFLYLIHHVRNIANRDIFIGKAVYQIVISVTIILPLMDLSEGLKSSKSTGQVWVKTRGVINLITDGACVFCFYFILQ